MADLRADLVRRVRDNLRDGASQLARVALECLEAYASVPADDAGDLHRRLLAFADELAGVRPSMTAIHELVGRWRASLAEYRVEQDRGEEIESLRRHARDEARRIRAWADEATDATLARAVDRLGDRHRLLTHSISSTVDRVLRELPRDGLSVVVTESRPGLEGWTLAADLAREGIAITYITDAQAGIFVEQVDAVLFGADAILEDGSVVNKAGTRLIALAAREAGVPVYVCSESFKCTQQSRASVALEEKSGSELRPPPVPGVRARNCYFEITPPELITDWLSDRELAPAFGRS